MVYCNERGGMSLVKFEKELDGLLIDSADEVTASQLVEQLQSIDRDALTRLLAKSVIALNNERQSHSKTAVTVNLMGFMQAKALPDTKKGSKFKSGRAKNAITEKTKHIYEVVARYPELSAKEIYVKADKNIIGFMTERTFANHVTAAKKL